MRNWFDLEYLRTGSLRQRAARRCLQDLRVFDALSAYRPVLVSTICIGIDVPASDLDVVCETDDFDEFAGVVEKCYGSFSGFECRAGRRADGFVTARFQSDGFAIELYAEQTPVERQNAFRHLSVMARLLAAGGEALRDGVRGLKRKGWKSEPAFARLLGLEGDPYRALLELEDRDARELEALIARAAGRPSLAPAK